MHRQILAGLFAMGAALALAGPAPAQTPTAKQDLGQPAEAETQQPWLLDCDEAEGFSQGRCRILQTVLIKDSGQPLLTAAVERRPGVGGYSLVLKVPHGIFLPPGLAIDLEGTERQVLKYRLSDATGIFAATRVDDAFLEALKKGETLKVSVVTSQGQKVGVPVTLRGFSAAFEELRKRL